MTSEEEEEDDGLGTRDAFSFTFGGGFSFGHFSGFSFSKAASSPLFKDFPFMSQDSEASESESEEEDDDGSLTDSDLETSGFCQTASHCKLLLSSLSNRLLL